MTAKLIFTIETAIHRAMQKKTFGKAIAANNGINNLRIKKEGF